jgi:hypothetical protein
MLLSLEWLHAPRVAAMDLGRRLETPEKVASRAALADRPRRAVSTNSLAGEVTLLADRAAEAPPLATAASQRRINSARPERLQR